MSGIMKQPLASPVFVFNIHTAPCVPVEGATSVKVLEAKAPMYDAISVAVQASKAHRNTWSDINRALLMVIIIVFHKLPLTTGKLLEDYNREVILFV